MASPPSTVPGALPVPEPALPVLEAVAAVPLGEGGDGLPARLPGFRGTFAWGLVRALRPRQWVKNVLVLAAPLAAGRILEPEVLRPTAIVFGLFCMVSSGVYLVNDTIDVQEDRRHPRKRLRPIAAGIVPRPLAVVLAAVLFALALTLSGVAVNPAVTAVLAGYVVVQLAYCFFLKNEPVIDLAVVASGFLLRGVVGGVAASLELSRWFLLVAAFGSLFMVAGKRYSELVALHDASATRKTLKEYSASYLRFVWSLSAGVACTAYCLWAFDMANDQQGVPWATISIAPFVLAILRYAVDVDKGAAGAPEDIVLHDRVLLSLSVVWVLTVGAGIFIG